MNGKERVRAAIARETPDRVPLGLYAIDCDTASRVLGRKTPIRDKPGQWKALHEGRRDELAAQLKEDVVDLFRKLDLVDLLTFKEADALPPRGWEPPPVRELGDGRYEMPDGSVIALSWESNDVARVHSPHVPPEEYTPQMFPLPDPDEHAPPDESCYEVFDHLASVFGEDRYLLCLGKIQCMPMLGGMEEGLMQYALAPEAVEAAARQYAASQALDDATMLRPGADGALIEEDMAGTNGLLISPAQWRELCLPHLARRVAQIKECKPQVVLHCCGRAFDILDDVAAAGVDAFQSLQTFAGMHPGVLCREYGDKLAFWGGGPVEYLVGGTAEEIRAAVRETMEETAAFPGFIFGPSHSIAYGTKYDNFMAMLDEFERLRDRG